MAKKKASKKKATKKTTKKVAVRKSASPEEVAAKKEADAEAAGGLMKRDVAAAYIDSVIGVALMMSDLARKSLRNLKGSKNDERISEIGKAYKAINIALAPLARKVPR